MINQINGQSNNPQSASGIIYAQVPEGVKYISDWPGFQLLSGHVIYDKTVTGCGFTEYCLRNDEDVILVSPRKILLKNKAEQHSKNPNVYYFSIPSPDETFDRTLEDIDRDVKKEINDLKKSGQSKKQSQGLSQTALLKRNLFEFVQKQTLDPYRGGIKILVTYDSFHYIAETLGKEILDNFRVVVDEFQSIFTDAQFKAEVGLNIVSDLENMKDVIFVSATPVSMSYLNTIPQLSGLTHIKFQWPVGYLTSPSIIREYSASLSDDAIKIIKSYRSGIFPMKKDQLGYIHESREAVFFMNNVSMITSLVKKLNLDPEEVNIICADTSSNRKKISSIRKGTIKHIIGKIPLKGAPHKMFTFCTKTSYLGADFYSTCASTFIFSDVNIKTMAVDIILDFPQIIGRQRLQENIFKNDVHIFYKTRKKEEDLTLENFDKMVKDKLSSTAYDLSIYEKSEPKERLRYLSLLRMAIVQRQDYSGIQRVLNLNPNLGNTETLVRNPFLMASDRRAWEIVQVSYQNNLSVTNTINSVFHSNYGSYTPPVDFQSDIDQVLSQTKFPKLLNGYCELVEKYTDPIEISEINSRFASDCKVKAPFESYYSIFGPNVCKSPKVSRSKLDERAKDLVILQDSERITNELLKVLKVGEKYTLTYIKDLLSEIFKYLGITTIQPQAIDLNQFLIVSQVELDSKSRTRAYKIKGKRQ